MSTTQTPNEETKNAPNVIDFREPNQADIELALLDKEGLSKQGTEKIKDDSDWQYFQRCTRGHIAFFYKGNPLNKAVEQNDWYSKYKRQDEPWRDLALCQACSTYDTEGHIIEEYPVKVSAYLSTRRQPTKFMVDPTWIYRYSKNAKKRAEIPAHRAAIIDISAGNVGSVNPDFPDRVKNVRDGRKEFARG